MNKNFDYLLLYIYRLIIEIYYSLIRGLEATLIYIAETPTILQLVVTVGGYQHHTTSLLLFYYYYIQ